MTTVEHEGVTLTAEYSEFGDQMAGSIRLPSGKRVTYEIDRDGGGCFYDHGGADLRTPEDAAVADRLFPLTPDRPGGKVFRRPSAALAAAVLALVPADARPYQYTDLDRAEGLAMLDLEGTPLRSPRRRPDRMCIECGSPVYGEVCTHCHEG
jgi:hypothetical protein